MNEFDIASMISLHQSTYDLFLWVQRAAHEDPSLLDPKALSLLSKKTTAREWFVLHRARLPRATPDDESFVLLFASYFGGSFRVTELTWENALIDTSIHTRSHKGESLPIPFDKHLHASLKWLATSAGKNLSLQECASLAKREELNAPVRIWAYVWELWRRSRGKANGSFGHQVWRALPVEVRKDFSVARAQGARDAIVEAM